MELAIVLAIIAALSFAVLRGTGVIGGAKLKDVVAVSQDMTTAVREFRKRYRMFPGDLLIAAANPEIGGVSAACVQGGANAGNNNGVISAIESPCVPEVLFRSGVVGKSIVDAGGTYTIPTGYGNAAVMAASVSGVAMPATVQNALTLQIVPCDVAMDVDRSLDDGNLGSGTVRGSVATCTPQGANDPVPILAIGL